MQLSELLEKPELFRQQCFTGGVWRTGARSFDVTNPATGEVLGQVPDLGADETEQAIAAAHAAWPAWRGKTAGERARSLRTWWELILEHREDLAKIMTAEQGKPLAEARGEIAYAASFVEWFAEEARRVYGDILPPPRSDRRTLVLKEPVGVAACITPWNFPSAMITRKAAAALAAGCPVIIKPAEQTPFSALALAALAEEAGIPAGVFNVITGDAATIGKTLCASPLVRKLSFTGSTEVGRLLIRQSADTVKKLSMELGGNAPFIVFADADLEKAAEGMMASKYRNSGQTCICANRILVQESVIGEFAALVEKRIAALKTGNGFEEGVTQGPLIDDAALEKVERLVADASAKGAEIRLGGKRHARGGNFYEPTLLTSATRGMAVFDEEIFGPVTALFPFTDEAEAIRLANDTPYGLAAYFYTQDMGRIFRVAERLEYGMVGANETAISDATAPFGGIKQSGLGREGSRYGIEEFLEVKYLCVGGVGNQ